ncbi:MAG: universal stress protein [Microthrixaceae bacterium]
MKVIATDDDEARSTSATPDAAVTSILVATDGSPTAIDAVRWSANLASALGAELTVMTSFVPVESELPPHLVERRLAEVTEQLAEWSEPARLPGLAVNAIVERGDPRQTVPQVAERVDADLVVVGRVGSSTGPGVLRLSSLPEHLAHHCDRPLAVIGGDVHPEIERIIVGADGSENCLAALRWTASTARDSATTVIAAFVLHPADDPLGVSSPHRQEQRQRVLDQSTEVLAEAGVDVETRALIATNPADGLLAEARREHADLIVVGMRGLGGFTGLRVGRVAMRSLHLADRPVVLVPPPNAAPV